ncbi:MAG TPA: hypothetical protein VGF14_05245 [Alphaproteobacteria bacterium]
MPNPMTRNSFYNPALQAGLWLLVGAFFMLQAGPAFAQSHTLGEVVRNTYTDILPAQSFLSAICFVLGVWYCVGGIQMLRSTGEGGQNAKPLSASLFKLCGGAALIALPFMVNMMMQSTTGGGLGQRSISLSGDSARSFSGPGLDEAMGRFVTDFFKPFMGYALPYFCYLAGLILLIRGIQRLANGDGKGPTAPGGFGSWMIFIISAGLMSLGYLMNILQGSLFGVNELYANVLLCDQSPLSDRAEDVLWAIFQFLRIVGYISVVRGLFMLKTHADGGQASLMGASTHIIAGGMLANVYYFSDVVQRTFVQDAQYFVFKGFGGGGC